MTAKQIKKWLPFFALVLAAVISAASFLFNTSDGSYQPQTRDPQVIYNEACKTCHGAKGEGNGLYPSLQDELLLPHRVRKSILEGHLFMPAYIHIKGDTLEALVEFISSGQFMN